MDCTKSCCILQDFHWKVNGVEKLAWKKNYREKHLVGKKKDKNKRKKNSPKNLEESRCIQNHIYIGLNKKNRKKENIFSTIYYI